jgi:hypothetical protein
MLRKLVLAAVVAASLTAGVPAAHAARVRSACGFATLAQETATGGRDTFTGVAYGYAVFDDQDTRALRCYVTVDGSEQASTPTGTGSVVVSTQGQVTYSASDGSNVALCTEIDGVTIECGAATGEEVPSQEVVDVAGFVCEAFTPPPPLDSDCPPYSWIAEIRDRIGI